MNYYIFICNMCGYGIDSKQTEKSKQQTYTFFENMVAKRAQDTVHSLAMSGKVFAQSKQQKNKHRNEESNHE